MNPTLELAKKLIRYETQTPVKNEDSLEFIQTYLEEEGLESKIHDFDGIKSLTAQTGEKPKICLNGHLDVVEPGEGWTKTDPYVPEVQDGKLYGRGASDMKANLAALINSYIELVQDDDFQEDIVLMVVGDEEIGGFNGTGKLVYEYESVEFVLVGEPTGLDLKVGCRGIAHADVILKGESSHAATPEHVDQIIDYVPEVMNRLKAMEFNWDSRENFPEPTNPVTILKTDETRNKVPERVKLGMDVRYSLGQTDMSIRQDIESALEGIDVDLEVDVEDLGKPFVLEDEEVENLASKIIEQVTGKEPERKIKGGSSDGRFFTEIDAPHIRFGVEEEPNHKVDEWCSLEALELTEQVYLGMVRGVSSNVL